MVKSKTIYVKRTLLFREAYFWGNFTDATFSFAEANIRYWKLSSRLLAFSNNFFAQSAKVCMCDVFKSNIETYVLVLFRPTKSSSNWWWYLDCAAHLVRQTGLTWSTYPALRTWNRRSNIGGESGRNSSQWCRLLPWTCLTRCWPSIPPRGSQQRTPCSATGSSTSSRTSESLFNLIELNYFTFYFLSAWGALVF